MSTKYIDFYSLTELQRDIAIIIREWAKTHKTPIPRKEITKKMKKKGFEESSVKNAIKSLIMKGYIRKAIIISNSSFYVLLKTNF